MTFVGFSSYKRNVSNKFHRWPSIYELWNSMCEAKRLRRATSKAARDDVWTRAQPTIILPDHHRSSISCKRNSTNFGIFPAQCFPVWNWNWTWQEAIVQQGLKPPKALEDLSEAWFTKIFPKYSIRLLMYLIELAGLLRMASTSFHAVVCRTFCRRSTAMVLEAWITPNSWQPC